jgi:hypothetical protein
MVAFSRSVVLSGLALEIWQKELFALTVHQFKVTLSVLCLILINNHTVIITYLVLGTGKLRRNFVVRGLSVCTFACEVLTSLAILISDITTARWVVLVIDKHVYTIYGLSIAVRQKLINFINCFDISLQECKTLIIDDVFFPKFK